VHWLVVIKAKKNIADMYVHVRIGFSTRTLTYLNVILSYNEMKKISSRCEDTGVFLRWARVEVFRLIVFEMTY
jgi:hypothetical protein